MEQPAESPETQTPETHPEPAEAEVQPEPEAVLPQSDTENETVAVSFSAEEILGDESSGQPDSDDGAVSVADAQLLAVLEAIIYVTDEPLTLDQIAEATEQPRERISQLLDQLCAEYDRPERGLSIREVAGGFRMTTKPEHHEAVRRFVKNLNPPIKLS
jgi:segregation and condensation protein B